jgi:hypothetical protein
MGPELHRIRNRLCVLGVMTVSTPVWFLIMTSTRTGRDRCAICLWATCLTPRPGPVRRLIRRGHRPHDLVMSRGISPLYADGPRQCGTGSPVRSTGGSSSAARRPHLAGCRGGWVRGHRWVGAHAGSATTSTAPATPVVDVRSPALPRGRRIWLDLRCRSVAVAARRSRLPIVFFGIKRHRGPAGRVALLAVAGVAAHVRHDERPPTAPAWQGRYGPDAGWSRIAAAYVGAWSSPPGVVGRLALGSAISVHRVRASLCGQLDGSNCAGRTTRWESAVGLTLDRSTRAAPTRPPPSDLPSLSPAGGARLLRFAHPEPAAKWNSPGCVATMMGSGVGQPSRSRGSCPN